MRIHAKYFLTGVAVVFLALPVWAQTETTELTIDHPETIGATQLKPGDYEFRVKSDATQLEVLQEGSVVAQIPCHWIQLPNKAETTQVSTSNDKITEIDFGGKTAAVQIP
ncbi:MAG: hypothetical protein WA871_15535 [Candidatus Acidiferrales bacterium]